MVNWKAFQNGMHIILDQGGWRDNIQFLFHSTYTFQFFHEEGETSFISFQEIPDISCARWNSQAILALLAYFRIPKTWPRLQSKVSSYIAYEWSDHWFNDQMFKADDFAELSNA